VCEVVLERETLAPLAKEIFLAKEFYVLELAKVWHLFCTFPVKEVFISLSVIFLGILGRVAESIT